MGTSRLFYHLRFGDRESCRCSLQQQAQLSNTEWRLCIAPVNKHNEYISQLTIQTTCKTLYPTKNCSSKTRPPYLNLNRTQQIHSKSVIFYSTNRTKKSCYDNILTLVKEGKGVKENRCLLWIPEQTILPSKPYSTTMNTISSALQNYLHTSPQWSPKCFLGHT